jgi:hypothetical protein
MSNNSRRIPAFPQHPDFHTDDKSGMTLRDYFAAKALEGQINTAYSYAVSNKQEAAEIAYAFADAMLIARAGKEGA